MQLTKELNDNEIAINYLLEVIRVLKSTDKCDSYLNFMSALATLLIENDRKFVGASYHRTFKFDKLCVDVWFNNVEGQRNVK